MFFEEIIDVYSESHIILPKHEEKYRTFSVKLHSACSDNWSFNVKLSSVCSDKCTFNLYPSGVGI
jgi:hypothetical protein